MLAQTFSGEAGHKKNWLSEQRIERAVFLPAVPLDSLITVCYTERQG